MIIRNPIGKKGEDIAVEFLKRKGYKILERNFRKQYAEIDIIALQPAQQIQRKSQQEAVLVFVEVKTRTSISFGTPFEAITKWKLRPVTKLAEYYQITHPHLTDSMRIDAIAVILNAIDEVETIEHVENVGGF